MSNNLNSIVKKTATQWKKRAAVDRKNRQNISRAQEFALELMDYMDDNSITQKSLALKMDVSSQQVNKILRAKANLTFETIDKIQDALGIKIESPKILTEVNYIKHNAQVSFTMRLKRKKGCVIAKENFNTVRVVNVNPLLETTVESMNEYDYTAVQI